MQRVVSVADALPVLQSYPEGMPVAELADQLGVSVDDLTEDLEQASLVDVVDPRVTPLHAGIAFVDDTGMWVPAKQATRVRLVDDEAFDAMGLNLLSPVEALLLVQIGRAIARVDRDPHLLSALDKLEEAVRLSTSGGTPEGVPILDTLNAAISQRRRITIVYSKAWSPAVITRTVEPLGLALVDGVWELDAGPVDAGDIRSYLVRRIRSCEVLAETFEVNDEMRRLLAARRGTADVLMVVPADMVWLLDTAADKVVVERSDHSGTQVAVTVREPIEARLGVILAAMGPEAFVVHPPHYRNVQASAAARLLGAVLGAG
jgi:predicted DNA-binding transcriptional regulator YafY